MIVKRVRQRPSAAEWRVARRFAALEHVLSQTAMPDLMRRAYRLHAVGRAVPSAPQEEFSPQYDLDSYSLPESAPYQIQHSAHSASLRLCVGKLVFRAECRP